MGIAAVTYLGGYAQAYADIALQEARNIRTICDADACHGRLESIFRSYTPIGVIARTYEERIRDYEHFPQFQ